jgi:hypothetical protein
MDKRLVDALNRYEQSVATFEKIRKKGLADVLKLIAEINVIIKYNMCYDVSKNPVILDPKKHRSYVTAGGHIRVGRYRGKNEPGDKIPITDGFVNVIVTSHNQKGLGASLSPYVVADSKDRIMENLWQFSKVYTRVHAQKQPNWTWDAEEHYITNKKTTKGKLSSDYWEWRQAGMEHDKPIRYPNGFRGKAECLFALWPKDGSLKSVSSPKAKMEELGYIEARKKIYAPLYVDLAKDNLELKKLQDMLEDGISLQIIDVDGPDIVKATGSDGVIKEPYDTMPKGIHGVTSGVGSIEITKQNIHLLMNDPDQPFGHGYVLACMLLERTDWLE